MKNQNIIIIVLVAIIFTTTGFFIGIKYQQSKSFSPRIMFNGQLGDRSKPNGNGRAGFRGGQILGEIISVDTKSITIKLTDGSSKIVLFSDTTPINQANPATVADLKVGAKVATFGTVNSDGSVTAQNIQLNPILRGQMVTPAP